MTTLSRTEVEVGIVDDMIFDLRFTCEDGDVVVVVLMVRRGDGY